MAADLTDSLARARHDLDVNRVLLAASRQRIAASRRLLNPYFAVDGGSATPGPEGIRSLISNGHLFPLSEGMRVFAGPGTGKRCVVCHEPITASEVEYEVRPGVRDPLHCHLPCFAAWRRESLDITGVWPV